MDFRNPGIAPGGIPGSSLPSRVLMAISQRLATLARQWFAGAEIAALIDGGSAVALGLRPMTTCVSMSSRTIYSGRGRSKKSSGNGSSKSSAT